MINLKYCLKYNDLPQYLYNAMLEIGIAMAHAMHVVCQIAAAFR